MHPDVATLDVFTDRLVSHLRESGMRDADVCRRAGIPYDLLSRVKLGKNEGRWRGVTAIARALGITPNDLQLADGAKFQARDSECPERMLRAMRLAERIEGRLPGFLEDVTEILGEIEQLVIRRQEALRAKTRSGAGKDVEASTKAPAGAGKARPKAGKVPLPTGTMISKPDPGITLYDPPPKPGVKPAKRRARKRGASRSGPGLAGEPLAPYGKSAEQAAPYGKPGKAPRRKPRKSHKR